MAYIGIVKDRTGNVVYKSDNASDKKTAARKARTWMRSWGQQMPGAMTVHVRHVGKEGLFDD